MKTKIKRYTIGIVFSDNFEKVILISKKRPDWQQGKMNFPGGKYEASENLAQSCIAREFREETSLNIPFTHWFKIGEIRGRDYVCDILTAVYLEQYGELKTTTDENVAWYYTHSLPRNLISNIRFLIPFATAFYVHAPMYEDMHFATFYYH